MCLGLAWLGPGPGPPVRCVSPAEISVLEGVMQTHMYKARMSSYMHVCMHVYIR